MATNEPLHIEEIDTNAHLFFNMMHYRKKNINTIIPVLKHLEYCRKLAKVLRDTIEKYEEHVNVSYNNEVLDNLTYIEQNGLQMANEVAYSEYNIYTSTGRPSNRFGGINFAALNKTDGSRKPFVSRFKNGVLVEMDFDGYHLRLIADKVGYEFSEGSVHEHMAKFYGCDYEESKRKSFRYLYGGIPIEVVQLNPFFGKVYDFVNELWEVYYSKEFIVSDIYSKKIYRKNLTDMNANKLFNYTIQLMETENNMKVLGQLIPKIKDYRSKLVLYSYDSFLFDFNMEDGLDYLKKVKNTLEQDGKYPVKVSWGLNYHEMKDITEKFV
jgi:DNA polymerase III delta prime subunit